MYDMARAEHELLDELSEGANLKRLVNLCAKILDNPVAFHLLGIFDIERSDNFPRDVVEDFINCRVVTSDEEKGQYISIAQAIIFQGKPHIQSWPLMRHRRLTCGSLVHGNALGYITLPQMERPLEEIDPALVGLVARVYGLALEINRCPHGRNSEYSLLWGLLTKRVPLEYLKRNVIYPLFKGMERFRMLWFRLITEDGRELQEAEIARLLSPAQREWHIAIENGIAVLADGKDDSLCRKLDASARDANVVIGASNVFIRVEEAERHFRDAQYAVRFAQGSLGDAGLASHDDYILSRLLFAAGEHVDLSSFIFGRIHEIDSYDQKNGTEYGKTLRVFLHENQTLTAAADKLCVHKNTVLYRIRRLKELFGIDFSNSRQLATLVASLLIQDMRT